MIVVVCLLELVPVLLQTLLDLDPIFRGQRLDFVAEVQQALTRLEAEEVFARGDEGGLCGLFHDGGVSPCWLISRMMPLMLEHDRRRASICKSLMCNEGRNYPKLREVTRS